MGKSKGSKVDTKALQMERDTFQQRLALLETQNSQMNGLLSQTFAQTQAQQAEQRRLAQIQLAQQQQGASQEKVMQEQQAAQTRANTSQAVEQQRLMSRFQTRQQQAAKARLDKGLGQENDSRANLISRLLKRTQSRGVA